MPVIDTYSSSIHHSDHHQHPFSFFIEQSDSLHSNDSDNDDHQSQSENKNSRFQEVLKFGKKWLG